ncbi:hypothetical protein [Luteitalea pratensis]|nr:hypothetical protein [Luteitalea pratensis]
MLRQPEIVWASTIMATVMLSLMVTTQVASMTIQLVVATAATCGAFSCVRPRPDVARPVLGVSRALVSSVVGSFLVFTWLAVSGTTLETTPSAAVFHVVVLIWFIQLALAAHLATLARAGGRLADGWRAAVLRSPEVLWLTLTLLIAVTWRIGPELSDWSGASVMAVAPMTVVFGCLALLLRTPAELRPAAALFRTIVSCFIGLTATTLLMTESPTIGGFRSQGAEFVWAFVLFWQSAITAVCGLLAWAVVREMMTLRTAVRVFFGGAAAIVLAYAAWIAISIL